MVLPIDVGFGHDEDIIKEQFAEVFEVVTFPVINARLKVFHRQFVFGSPLSLIDLISDTSRGIRSSLEFIIVRIARS